jgi:hypothetical protein
MVFNSAQISKLWVDSEQVNFEFHTLLLVFDWSLTRKPGLKDNRVSLSQCAWLGLSLSRLSTEHKTKRKEEWITPFSTPLLWWGHRGHPYRGPPLKTKPSRLIFFDPLCLFSICLSMFIISSLILHLSFVSKNDFKQRHGTHVRICSVELGKVTFASSELATSHPFQHPPESSVTTQSY